MSFKEYLEESHTDDTTDTLSEAMKDAKKIDFSEYETGVTNSIEALQKAGFGVKFDEKTMSGEASYLGHKVKFSVGSENLYFDIPSTFVKGASKEGAKALMGFMEVIVNYGGIRR
jgi:hypothetical protein